MALMNSIGASDSLYKQQPQQNQYLTGNPATQPEANTSWMNPTDTSGGGLTGNIAQTQPNPPSQVSNGTMLGSIAAGNVGQFMPGGYDQNKWNDPNKHDPKYDVGRILSKYPPSTAGLQAAMNELSPLGYKMAGKDTIIGPDGVPIDVGFSFGSGQGSTWQWNPKDNQQMPGNSMLQQGNNNPSGQNNLMNMIWQALQQQRQIQGNQQFNPTGGALPINSMQGNVDIQSLLGLQSPMTGGAIGTNSGLNPDVLSRTRI